MAGKGDDTDRLYELALDEFTPARDALAKELRATGDREEADAVKRLRKPSVAAWALNRVRREHPDESEALLEAGDRLRESQEGLLSGGDRDAFQEAVAEERRLVGELAELAARELADARRALSAAVEEKLRATLHAVAVDDEAREAFDAGRLVSDHEASGLGLFGAGAAPGAPAAARR